MSDAKSEEKSVAQKTREGMAWFTLLPSAFYFLSFANSIIVARILSPEDFGIMGVVAVLIHYCDSFTNFGIANAIIQRRDVKQSHVSTFFTFNLIVSLAFFIAFFFSAEQISHFFVMPELVYAIQIYSLVFLLTALTAVPQMVLRKNLRFKELAIISSIRIVVVMVASLVLAILGWGYWSLIVATVIGQVFFVAALVFLVSYQVSLQLNLDRLKELMRFGVWDFFWGQVKLIGDNIDKLIVGKLLGAAPLGFYDKAYGLPKMPNEQVANRIQMVAFSSFSASVDNKSELKSLFIKLYTVCIVVCSPIFFGLYAVADVFTISLLGDRWAPMVSSFEILCLSFWFASVVAPITALNMALGKVKAQALMRGFLLILFIPAAIYSASYDIYYVALCVLAFNVVVLLGASLIALPLISLPLQGLFRASLSAVLGSAVMAVLVSVLQSSFFKANSISNMVALILFGGLIYGLWFFLVPDSGWLFLQQRVKDQIQKIYQR
jgi:PST family polysaccharide transporter